MEARIGGPHAPGRLGPGDFRRPKTSLRRNRTSAETPSEACCIIGRRPQATVQRGASAAASSVVGSPRRRRRRSWRHRRVLATDGGALRRRGGASTYSSGCARPIAISCSRGAVSRAASAIIPVFERALDRAPVIGPFGMALRSFAGEASRKGNRWRRHQVHLPIGGRPDVLPSLQNKFGPGHARQPPARASEGSASASRRGLEVGFRSDNATLSQIGRRAH